MPAMASGRAICSRACLSLSARTHKLKYATGAHRLERCMLRVRSSRQELRTFLCCYWHCANAMVWTGILNEPPEAST